VDVNEEVVDNEEASSESEETLYDVTVNGVNQKVNLNELMKGYSRESDYTKKTMDLSNQRKEVESMQENLKKEFDAVKSSRDQYATQLEILTNNLQQEEKVNWDQLYQEDPAEYVRKKAESDKRKEALDNAREEQKRIQQEQQAEQEKVYNEYIANERKILSEKLPQYADKNKSAEFTRRLTNFAKESGYSDQEIAMMVDHRAVLLLADAYRYNQLKKTKLADKKVNKTSKVVTSNASNIREDSEVNQNIDKRMSRLKKSGHLRDAQSVLKEMYFNE
jgi:predicted metal-dependent phosphoesterase TrpH